MRISDWSSDVCSSDLLQSVPENSRGSSRQLAEPAGQTGYECRHAALIFLVGLAELGQRLPFLLSGQPHVHPDQDREHREREQRRPLEEGAEQDQDKANILRMTDLGIGACSRERVPLLGGVENAPRRSDKPEAAADEGEAQEIDRKSKRLNPSH